MFETLLKLSEEPLKSKIKDLYFSKFNYVGAKIDFCITQNLGLLGEINLLWAEAKQGKSELKKSFVQLVLTIGKYKFYTEQTPNLLCAFDGEKIAFLPFACLQEIFYQSDIDFSVTPSNHTSEQFLKLLKELDSILNTAQIFYYEKNDEELKTFIKENLTSENISKIKIDKNNFVSIYHKWNKMVKDTISIDWNLAKKSRIIDADFYLADLLSSENETISQNLFAILKKDYYEFNKTKSDLGSIINERTSFKDNQKAHHEFWAIYERPPREEFWDYIIKRRDLLVDQDIRERKGAFFTPRIWVDKACEYLSKTFGEDYEEGYYIWDLSGGTGNLLANFTNKKNIFCSTLDKADIDVIHERIKNGANLFENHVFEFDFLNDEFFDKVDDKGKIIQKSNLPSNLQEILKDENKRKKLIIFINPPYAEATSATQVTGTGKNKEKVARENKICEKYKDILGKANNELFAQFFIRIYCEIEDCLMASFSTLKYVNSTNFIKFRENFKAKFLKGFMVPANTFDNVKGNFPIGFLIWDMSKKEEIKKIKLDVFNENGNFLGVKYFYNDKKESINKWLRTFNKKDGNNIGVLMADAPDFQQNNHIAILNKKRNVHLIFQDINENIINIAIYFSVRHIIEHTYINHNDQFLYPNDLYKNDNEFKSDCLSFMLFHGKNRISAKEGINHFIPFSEKELGITKEAFKSDFMYKFIKGNIKDENSLFGDELAKIEFSPQANELLKAGKELFKYYHTHSEDKNYLVNASLYDIKEFFQGRDEKGRMNRPSQAKDEHYKILLSDLNIALNTLAKKLEPKIYEYSFLKE
ncbi:hypothetical protein AJM72_03980 [Campylobacter jejuni]|uniref:hypothetical protein n=1 Tax=Campylobacter jejuni TaxID=197 RepID=UPI000874B838|nr:hypothetical protein [Campylobacter jejuni]ECR2419348.1 hypothetical protein [Campylobacter jejuni]ECR3130638.1 hypothetical protein [Campylobacter jejuni]ELH9168003.1 hypothetical protein [Campylobacter jejuni]OEV67734.1 hypothetical protein AJM72_03980 [Campylobacter jejuni]OEW52065.1 hypothetical protein AJM74_01405 [Campylobacter jejuni]